MVFSFFNILNLITLDSGEIKLMKLKIKGCWGWVCSSVAKCLPSVFEALVQGHRHTKLRGNISEEYSPCLAEPAGCFKGVDISILIVALVFPLHVWTLVHLNYLSILQVGSFLSRPSPLLVLMPGICSTCTYISSDAQPASNSTAILLWSSFKLDRFQCVLEIGSRTDSVTAASLVSVNSRCSKKLCWMVEIYHRKTVSE